MHIKKTVVLTKEEINLLSRACDLIKEIHLQAEDDSELEELADKCLDAYYDLLEAF